MIEHVPMEVGTCRPRLGGPCGGKSSSQDVLSMALVAAGYNVYFAPEVLPRATCQANTLGPPPHPNDGAGSLT